MRPLMVPDPQCASCHGTFVEKIESENDDPREFQHNGPANFEPDNLPPGIDNFLLSLHDLMERGSAERRHRNPSRSTTQPSGAPETRFRVEMRGPGDNATRTFTLGGQNTLREERPPGQFHDEVPTMSDFLRPSTGPQPRGSITGPIMAQYLMALLGQRAGSLDPLAGLFGAGPGGDRGRWGDYVLNQEALDQIISQLMENSNAHRPVPATDEIISGLPREVLEEKSPALQHDCAVCKEQFSVQIDDPDDLIIITLPCKHLFHERCITPWLKSSGTCPVCRFALIRQPEAPPAPDSTSTGRRPSGPSSPRTPNAEGSSDIFNSLFSYIGQGNPSGGSSRTRTNSDPGRGGPGRRRSGSPNIPGGWADQVD
jgi:E3 ubiquitin-protein ligase RNF115/126